MPRSKGRKPNYRGAKNIQAKLRIDPKSLAEHNAKLRKLAQVTREEVVRKALLKGGSLIQAAAAAKAPGPHIGIKVMTGAELSKNWKGAAAAGIKPEALYVAIGPDKEHWYYRFAEYGVKPHHVEKRVRTRFQQFSAKKKVARKDMRTVNAAGKMRRAGNLRPAMIFSIDGKLIFSRKVRGFPAKPFLRPAADTHGETAIKLIGSVLAAEIEKVARS